MATVLDRKLTVEEYLELDQASQFKIEYVDGKTREVTGASRLHNLLTWNIAGLLRVLLKGQAWEAYQGDMRVKTDEFGSYYYPDVVVAPSPPHILKDRGDTLLNPLVAFEILSPSTESIDRGEKLAHYTSTESLHHYLIVSQDQVRIDHYSREHDASWRLVIHDNLVESIELSSIGIKLPLAEIYDRIFPASPKDTAPTAP